ncbi:glycosyltransferase [Aquimarina sp. 2201CG1-2-11]|uniref:glycosyltransferase n=1 Tax=Aquimarina discodermiae TaxID=3231043 RepID=UPI003462C983
MKTGIIIPCHNEENRLDITAYLGFLKKGSDVHLCFVNDSSSDNTAIMLKDIQSYDPYKVSVLETESNLGKAGAIRTGAKYLNERADIKHIELMI